MHIALIALGSRGDVQPFIALGLALQACGHSVRLLAAADYAPLAADYRLPFHPLIGAISELMDTDLALQALDTANKTIPLGFARRFVDQVGALIPQLVADCLAGCQGADLLVAATLGCYPGALVAERLGVPLVPAHLHPSGTSAEYPDVSFPSLPAWLPGRGMYHRLTHQLARHGLWQLLATPLNRAREEVLHLPALSRGDYWRLAQNTYPLVLYGYSPALLPPARDWPSTHQVTGYWLVDSPSDWNPPSELCQFTNQGAPPIYIGFGSILAGPNPAALIELLSAALAQAGLRGVLYRGAWGDLDQIPLPPHLFRIADTPHSWLFPKVAAVITHGGAGTVAAALCGGTPILTIPAFGDQRVWGERIAALYAGPQPIGRAELSLDRLVAALRQIRYTPEFGQRAKQLGRQIRTEQGAAKAAALIDACFANR